MQHRVVGTTMPVLEFVLDPNDAIFSEAGELSWMGSSIQMSTHTQMGGGGGLLGALKRVAGGGTLFMTEYRAVGASGELAFATKLPGHIVPVEIGPGGFVLQHLGGQGTAWLELSGELVVKDLQRGETLRVHPGHVGAFESGVGFQITRVPGIKNMLFGGDGIFLASLTGPGRVWLQTLPISRLAHILIEYMPAKR